MDRPHLEILTESLRPAMRHMLEESDDVPPWLPHLYRRGKRDEVILIAGNNGVIQGMVSGYFTADFFQSMAFPSFDLPPAPHALIERIHVRPTARGGGIGRALMWAFADSSLARGCSFIAGSIDQSSDARVRTEFLKRVGFTIGERDSVGATPAEILAAIELR